MRRNTVALITMLMLLILWEAAVRLFALPMYILPAPSAMFLALAAMIPQLGPHVFATLTETLLGIGAAVLFGALAALAMDALPSVKKALYPLIAASQSIPVLVIAPLLIIYLGFGAAPKIFMVAMMCFFPVTVNLAASMAETSEESLNLLRSLGAGRITIYRYLKLPAALPGFFSGLRISATYSVTGAVVGEWLSADRGLGFIMLRAKNAYMLDRVFAIVLLVVFISLALLGAVILLEKVCMPYRVKQNVY